MIFNSKRVTHELILINSFALIFFIKSSNVSHRFSVILLIQYVSCLWVYRSHAVFENLYYYLLYSTNIIILYYNSYWFNSSAIKKFACTLMLYRVYMLFLSIILNIRVNFFSNGLISVFRSNQEGKMNVLEWKCFDLFQPEEIGYGMVLLVSLINQKSSQIATGSLKLLRRICLRPGFIPVKRNIELIRTSDGLR